MPEEAADGAEVVVTDEMLEAAFVVCVQTCTPGEMMPGGELCADIYRAMRALEPAPKGFRIYDPDTDDMRDVTAADVAKWQAVTKAYGTLRRHVEAVQAELMRDVAGVKG